MKSADICFLVFLFIKRRSGTGQCIRAFPDLTFDDDQNSESINFLVLLDYLWWCITLFLVMFLSTEKPSCHSSSPNLKWFYFPYQKKKDDPGASLVAQWWRIQLSLQETPIGFLVRADPARCRNTRPACHNDWGCSKAGSCDYWARCHSHRNPRHEKLQL